MGLETGLIRSTFHAPNKARGKTLSWVFTEVSLGSKYPTPLTRMVPLLCPLYQGSVFRFLLEEVRNVLM